MFCPAAAPATTAHVQIEYELIRGCWMANSFQIASKLSPLLRLQGTDENML